MRNLENVTMAVTHTGIFHTDDVFSAALLKLLKGNDFPIIRVADATEYLNRDEYIVFDIGYGEFDHHQDGSPVRENGIPYAAFGLLWRAYGHLVVNDISSIDEMLCQPIDSHDNGVDKNPLSQTISCFIPPWDSNDEMDTAFFRAVDIAVILLRNIIASDSQYDRSDAAAPKYAEKSIDAGYPVSIIVMDRYVPVSSIAKYTDARFMIYPSRRGGYNAQVVSRQDDVVVFPDDVATNEFVSFVAKGNWLIGSDNKDKLAAYCASL